MNKEKNNNIKYHTYFFLFFLIIVYAVLDYQTILFLHPQGIHFIRQTDSLSFVANYFNNGFDFFQPQVYNLQSTDGRAACEFPILYYITAICYYFFDEHEFILRLITILISSTGFIYLFKLLYTFLHDFVYSLVFCFLFISSTVLLYYINNFLPDASALGFTLIGWYYFFIFINDKHNKRSLYLCFILFTLASLIKVTYFTNPTTAILSIIVYDFYLKNGIKNILKNNLIPLIGYFLSFLVILSWNSYIIYYNKINHDNYFLIRSVPIWLMSKNQIQEAWGYMYNYWYSKYYYQSTFHVFIGFIITSIIFLKKSEKNILIPTLILTTGNICYLLLFWGQFKDHDYYFITLIPAIVFIIINSFITLKNKFPGLINNWVTKLLLLTLCFLSLNYARANLVKRYNDKGDNFANIGFKLSGARHYLDSLGVSKNAKVIIITDQTPNGGLYFVNRQGWSLKDTTESSIKMLNNYINQGADYIIFTDKKYYLNKYNGLIIGENNGILIFQLKKDS